MPSLTRGHSALGHAVAGFTGSGDLLVRDNVFQENGNDGVRTLLHELLIDWRGDAAVRGNSIRHTGGGEGGAAILIATENIEAALVSRLARIEELLAALIERRLH